MDKFPFKRSHLEQTVDYYDEQHVQSWEQLVETATKQINRAIENLSFAIQVYKNKFGELANPVISLQSKLDTLLICGMEMSFAPFENSVYSNDEPITVNLDPPNMTLAVPSLVTA